MASKYYKITLLTFDKLEKLNTLNKNIIFDCWNKSLNELGINYKKGCPKYAFTSLVLNDHVIFRKNKYIQKDFITKEYLYCKTAIDILNKKRIIIYPKIYFWKLINNQLSINRSHQGELDVILALWENKILR